MIEMMAQIGEILDSRSQFPDEAFCFSLSDRVALGDAAVRRVGENAYGPAFHSVTRFDFEEALLDESNQRARLFRSEKVCRTLEAVDRAIQGEPLVGRERLSKLQCALVDLLTYLEKKEGFKISFGERRRATLHNEKTDEGVKVVHRIAGRTRLIAPSLRNNSASVSDLQQKLESLQYVTSVRINERTGSVVVEHLIDTPESELIKALAV
jgi:hypothetical protein